MDPTGHILRQAVDDSINKDATNSSNWFTAGVKTFFKEAGYQTLDVISFGALHRQDKLVDQNLSGQISDAEYHGRTGVNVVLSGAQAAMTLGTGGAAGGGSAGASVLYGAAGGMAGQAFSDVGEIYGTDTKSAADIRVSDYLLSGGLGALGGYAGARARGPVRGGASEADKALSVIESSTQAPRGQATPPVIDLVSDGNGKFVPSWEAPAPKALPAGPERSRRLLPPGPQAPMLLPPAPEEPTQRLLAAGGSRAPEQRLVASRRGVQPEVTWTPSAPLQPYEHSAGAGCGRLRTLSPELEAGTPLSQSRIRSLTSRAWPSTSGCMARVPTSVPPLVYLEHRSADFRLGGKGVAPSGDIKPRGTPLHIRSLSLRSLVRRVAHRTSTLASSLTSLLCCGSEYL